MALFTDGPISSIEDLTAQDSQLLNVANGEGIDVTQKLTLAQGELALELSTLLSRTNYLGELFQLEAQPGIRSVVVTPALQLWHTFRALESVYGDAYNSQLNDRYAGRRDQFHQMAKRAYESLVESGIGIASWPVAKAATPGVAPVSGNLPDGTYYVTMAWTNSGGEEGACAVPAVATTSRTTVLVQPGKAPQNATGWNVYAGADPDNMWQQNKSPIAIGESWLQPDALLRGGQAAGSGQSPTYLKPARRLIQRG